MSTIFQEEIDNFVIVDILIYSKMTKEHTQHLETVFQRLKMYVCATRQVEAIGLKEEHNSPIVGHRREKTTITIVSRRYY